ncbi:MAG: tetraacyldisaccharide 4'-kinase [Hydrogenophaga sp.]|nr:tetraacyldisaccharide 4'-kinase [Hydrogenophaga sp.]
MPDRAAERQARWQALARQRGPGARLLWPLSQIYGALMGMRRALYAAGFFRSQRVPVPVIVVGNVVVGGAGKTPTVVALVQHLRQAGWCPGVVSRGYGRSTSETLSVTASTPPELSGDEPALIHRATGVPVFVARQRIDAARALLLAHPDINLLICDDGLQHLALARDLNVTVFDERGVGNGWLLPAGLLREAWPGHPASDTIPRLVLRQHREGERPPPVDAPPGVPAFNAARRLADHAVNARGERIELVALVGRPLTAVAGIARPQAFFDMLRSRGLTVTREVALPDHADAAAYGALTVTGGSIVCTEKDAVKLFEILRASQQGEPCASVWSVPLELNPEPGFFDAVRACLPPQDPDR